MKDAYLYFISLLINKKVLFNLEIINYFMEYLNFIMISML